MVSLVIVLFALSWLRSHVDFFTGSRSGRVMDPLEGGGERPLEVRTRGSSRGVSPGRLKERTANDFSQFEGAGRDSVSVRRTSGAVSHRCALGKPLKRSTSEQASLARATMTKKRKKKRKKRRNSPVHKPSSPAPPRLHCTIPSASHVSAPHSPTRL